MLGIDILTTAETIGYLGLAFIIFTETGLFFGFFLPGSSLIFSAGFLASQNLLHIWFLIPVLLAAAILGNLFGYITGRKFGTWLKTKSDTWYYKKKYLKKTEKFYKKHGRKTIFLARFIPIDRTFASIVAGIANMKFSQFTSYNIIGAAVWIVTVSLAGYYLGQSVPNIDQFLIPILLAIVFLSIIPLIWDWFQSKFN